MHLTRCSDQNHQSLDEFYGEAAESKDPTTRGIGSAMLTLIGRLRNLEVSHHVWGLTSHYNLVLLADDSYTTPWFVTMLALDYRNYSVEYLMPEDIAPWPNAYVKGQAQNADDAVRMILLAMEMSHGWRRS